VSKISIGVPKGCVFYTQSEHIGQEGWVAVVFPVCLPGGLKKNLAPRRGVAEEAQVVFDS